MRLTQNKLLEYKNKFNELGLDPIIFENGTFEIFDIDDADKINDIFKDSFVAFFNIAKDGDKYKVRGIIKNDVDESLTRNQMIQDLHKLGKNYNFSKFTDAQIYNIHQKELDKYNKAKDSTEEVEAEYCDKCGAKLNPLGECPVCDLGETDLNENVEIHDTLNPKIWTADNELIPEVRKAIIKITAEFIKTIREDGVKIEVEDIYILGSNANYNYNDDSDLDIHIIVNEEFDCSDKHLNIIYNAYKTLFNKKYDITIKGINTELYVENKDALTNVATGVYSLKKGWVRNPSNYEIPEIDGNELNKRVQLWENRYYDIINKPTVEKIDDYLNSIYDVRVKSLKEDGEFGIDNLAFKEIRRLGYLDNLKDIKTELTNKELSLESLDK